MRKSEYLNYIRIISFRAVMLIAFLNGCWSAGNAQFIHRGYAVMTHLAYSGGVPSPGVFDYAFTVYDLNAYAANLPGSVWDPPVVRPQNADSLSWSVDSVGTLFGVSFDSTGNIYLAATDCYQVNLAGMAGTGGIYRLDAVSGHCAPFIYTQNTAVFSDTTRIPNTGCGLGNICYDRWHNQLFVSNFEDGMIYRIGMNGNILNRFDPFLPDNALPGYAPNGERVWGLEVMWFPGNTYKLIFSRWNIDSVFTTTGVHNEIWSVDLNSSNGDFFSQEQLEIVLPYLANKGFSYPVSDISFDGNKKLLFSERGQSVGSCLAHNSRLLEYTRSGNMWLGPREIFLGSFGSKQNCAGGNDYGIFDPVQSDCILDNFTWATTDAIYYNDPAEGNIYGFTGVPLSGNSDNPLASDYVMSNGLFIDFNANHTDIPKGDFGDVEIYRYDTCGGPVEVITDSLCPYVKCVLPNVISPDGDGINDTLIFNCVQRGVCEASLTVFDRWGNLEAEFPDYENNWSPVNISDDVYYYILVFHDSGESFRSVVHIMR